MFEYYTFLHHSQTITYRFRGGGKFEYHTFLHHSQTLIGQLMEEDSLSTIHFYIILKPAAMVAGAAGSLSTIHFYIILKLP